jgi:enediyne polyketide synthase
MLRRVGTDGTVAVGHSLGELAALHWAGCFDEASLRVIAKGRGLAITGNEGTRGAMAAIAAGQDETARLIGDQQDLVVANINAPRQTIVAGDPDAVEALVGRAQQQGTAATPLRVRRAFHSPAMAGAALSLARSLDDIVFDAPERTVISTVTGDVLAAGVDLAAHLRDQLVKPVQFRAAISQAAAGVDLFVEVGPGEVMGDLVRCNVSTPVASLDVGGDSVAPYLRAVGASFVLGCAPAIRRLFEDRFARCFDWNWKPRFLENPCEMFAADDAACGGQDPRPGAVGRFEPGEEAGGERAGATGDHVRKVLAEHTGLPAWTFEDSSRMSSDLHLNSITVSEIVIRLTTARGIRAPVDSTEYANASVGEIAAALDLLAEAGAAGRGDPTAAPPGVAGWLRDFAVVRIPARPLVTADRRRPGTWEGFGASPPDAGHLVQRLNAEPCGSGVLVWIGADPGADQLASLLTAAHRCIERQGEVADPLRFVVIQHGWGGGGFARSFFLEQTSIDVLVVNLPPRSGAGATDWVVREIASRTGGFREVFIDASGEREETRWQPLEPSPTTGDLLGRDDVVLVTGGGKGITAECGFQLARRTGCALLVLGRSVPEGAPELARNLRRLRAADVRVSYQVAAIVAGTAELGLHVTGILHGAGVNRPGTVASMTVGELTATLAPKVTGLRNVLAAVDPNRLKLLSTFGSIIGRMGLEGEAHYALGNEWMSHETEAFQRRHPHCRCRAIEWSAWSGTGMGQRLGRIDTLERRGISPISVDEGVTEFLRLVETPGLPSQLVVSGRFGEPRTFNYTQPAPAGLRFLDSVLVNYPGIELVAQCELSRESDRYVDDHVLDGQHLFPAVMALEALTEAAGALLGRDARTLRLQFRDLAFRTAIVIPASSDASISIRVLALADRNGEVRLAIRCSSTQFQMNHVEARCRVRDDDGSRTEVPEFPNWPGEDLSAFDPGRSLYGNVLFQCGRFRRIERYQMIEARRCSSRLSGDGTTQWFAPHLPQAALLGDPGARDAALHAIQACIPHKIVIPVFVEQIDVGALDPSTTHYMAATEIADRGDELVYDLTIFDPEGRPVERWRNMTLRVVGQPPALCLDSPSLMAPYFERRVATGSPGAHLRVTLEGVAPGQRWRKRQPDTPHRPDGKPDPSGTFRFRSAAYTGEWRLAVAADMPTGCDLETVAHRELRSWELLLGADGLKLASVARELAGEQLDVSATRVWTVREALKKAGLPAGTPVVVDPESQADWIVFRAGYSIVYSSLITADGTHPAMCVAAALVDVPPTARRPQQSARTGWGG